MSDRYIVAAFYVGHGSERVTHETIGSLLGLTSPKRRTQYAVETPNLNELVQRLQDTCNEVDRAGYDVKTVMPMDIGSSSEYKNNSGGVVTTASFTPTRGAIVIGERRQEPK